MIRFNELSCSPAPFPRRRSGQGSRKKKSSTKSFTPPPPLLVVGRLVGFFAASLSQTARLPLVRRLPSLSQTSRSQTAPAERKQLFFSNRQILNRNIYSKIIQYRQNSSSANPLRIGLLFDLQHVPCTVYIVQFSQQTY